MEDGVAPTASDLLGRVVHRSGGEELDGDAELRENDLVDRTLRPPCATPRARGATRALTLSATYSLRSPTEIREFSTKIVRTIRIQAAVHTWVANAGGDATLHVPHAQRSLIQLAIIAGASSSTKIAAHARAGRHAPTLKLARADVEGSAREVRAIALSNLATVAWLAGDMPTLRRAVDAATEGEQIAVAEQNRLVLAQVARGQMFIGRDPCAR